MGEEARRVIRMMHITLHLKGQVLVLNDNKHMNQVHLNTYFKLLMFHIIH